MPHFLHDCGVVILLKLLCCLLWVCESYRLFTGHDLNELVRPAFVGLELFYQQTRCDLITAGMLFRVLSNSIGQQLWDLARLGKIITLCGYSALLQLDEFIVLLLITP